MIVSNKSLDVMLYIRGHNLDPDYVSELLGLEPTKKQFKGEKRRTSTGHVFVAQIGLWALAAESGSTDLSSLVDELALKICKNGISVSDIKGVEESYLDIFIAVDADDHGEATCEFQLDDRGFKSLVRMGVSARFTVAVIKE
jgi:Domain of unknown function (DUF4279)